MEDIRKYKLADYIDSFGDGIHGTPNYDENGEYYFINGNNLKNGKIEITSNTLKISSDEYKRIKRNLSDNTLLVSINGTLGNIAFYNNEKIALGKSACFLNLNKCACRPFIRYVLESKEFKTYMNRVAGQSTIKNVSPTQVSEYEFFAPSYSDQARIAKVLSTIDREITINREINRNLEELAKQIYDYWFVQFDFPNEEGKPYKSSGGKMVWNDVLKREIPDGWEGLDIGPKTREIFANAIKGAKTILWNGPAGVFEFDTFDKGSRAIADAVVEATKNGAFSLVGGGDSVACVNKFGLADQVSYVSTGGGALLEAIEGKVLPGVAAIKGE